MRWLYKVYINDFINWLCSLMNLYSWVGILFTWRHFLTSFCHMNGSWTFACKYPIPEFKPWGLSEEPNTLTTVPLGCLAAWDNIMQTREKSNSIWKHSNNKLIMQWEDRNKRLQVNKYNHDKDMDLLILKQDGFCISYLFLYFYLPLFPPSWMFSCNPCSLFSCAIHHMHVGFL